MNNGWRVTMTTLGNERGGNATTQHVEFTKQFWSAVEMLQKSGKAKDPIIRQELAWAYSHVEIMRFNGLKVLSEVIARKEPGPGASVNKMFWSEYAQKFSERMMNARGADAMLAIRMMTKVMAMAMLNKRSGQTDDRRGQTIRVRVTLKKLKPVRNKPI